MTTLTINSNTERFFQSNPLDSQDFTFKKAAIVPIEVVKDSTSWTRAFLRRDHEKVVDIAGNIAAKVDYTLTFLAAPMQLAILIGHYFQDLFAYNLLYCIVRIITLPLSIFYLWLALIEGIYECTNLSRSWDLLKKLHPTEWQKRDIALQDLTAIRTQFFELTAEEKKNCQAPEKELAEKSAALSRRVSPWCAKEVSSQINELIDGLEKGDTKAHERSIELLHSIDVQSKKKLLIHTIGLIAIAIFVVSVSLVLASNPLGQLAVIFSIAGVLFSVVRFGLEKGVLSQKGWHFSPKACVSWLRG